MNNKNPNVVLLMKDKINIDKFIDSMKKTWNYECKLEISKQANFISYLFKYNNISFVVSEFDTVFPEDIRKDIINSRYALKSNEIYNYHTNFCMVSVVGNFDTKLNMVYVSFTRIIMSLLFSHIGEECFVYDIRSKQVIDKEIYMKTFDNMKSWYEKNEEIFPVDWYVNYVIYKNEGKFNGITLGFEIFNDYEIEIHNKELSAEEMLKVIKYIVINVISRQDKIKNRDLISILINGNYDEAVVKQVESKVLYKKTLVVVF